MNGWKQCLDKCPYPRLLNHADDRVRLLAKQFADEMGDISQVYQIYLNQYRNNQRIKKIAPCLLKIREACLRR
ncbi:MAG: hypothetical protein H0Z35_08585 [Thermoanaerobacteraceae bacterium]|nr:hypothetical protein [Thermoanaerobacteraceae bacterium]